MWNWSKNSLSQLSPFAQYRVHRSNLDQEKCFRLVLSPIKIVPLFRLRVIFLFERFAYSTQKNSPRPKQRFILNWGVMAAMSLFFSLEPTTHFARQAYACPIFVAASHQTRLDTRSKARRPIKVGIKGRGRSGRSRDSSPACLCCSSAHLVQCEPDEASSFTNPNVGPGTYAS